MGLNDNIKNQIKQYVRDNRIDDIRDILGNLLKWGSYETMDEYELDYIKYVGSKPNYSDSIKENFNKSANFGIHTPDQLHESHKNVPLVSHDEYSKMPLLPNRMGTEWDEEKHDRDNDGKFTLKGNKKEIKKVDISPHQKIYTFDELQPMNKLSNELQQLENKIYEIDEKEYDKKLLEIKRKVRREYFNMIDKANIFQRGINEQILYKMLKRGDFGFDDPVAATTDYLYAKSRHKGIILTIPKNDVDWGEPGNYKYAGSSEPSGLRHWFNFEIRLKKRQKLPKTLGIHFMKDYGEEDREEKRTLYRKIGTVTFQSELKKQKSKNQQAAQWDEAKHPRADDGKFGTGSGKSKKSKIPLEESREHFSNDNRRSKITSSETSKIFKLMKTYLKPTKDPKYKTFLLPDGKWLQMPEGHEHWSVLGGITRKILGGEEFSKRNFSFQDYFDTGIVRAGFDPSVIYINGGIPLTSAQKESIETAMIEQKRTKDNLLLEFSDKKYEKKLPRMLHASIQARQAAQWSEDAHPRGQPKNKGQFVKKGEGVSGNDDVEKKELNNNKDNIDKTSNKILSTEEVISKMLKVEDKMNQALTSYKEYSDLVHDEYLYHKTKDEMNHEYRLTNALESEEYGFNSIYNNLYDTLKKHLPPHIHKDDLPVYEKFTKDMTEFLIDSGFDLEDLDRSQELADSMMDHVRETKTLYRGMRLNEAIDLLTFSYLVGGVDPSEGHVDYTPSGDIDFVPTTLSLKEAQNFGERYEGIVVRLSTDGISEEEMAPMMYKPRLDYFAYDPERINPDDDEPVLYRPEETFKGEHSSKHSHELEIRIKRATEVKIEEIHIPSDIDLNDDPEGFGKLYKLIKDKGIKVMRYDR